MVRLLATDSADGADGVSFGLSWFPDEKKFWPLTSDLWPLGSVSQDAQPFDRLTVNP
jgi:hypothetical protein